MCQICRLKNHNNRCIHFYLNFPISIQFNLELLTISTSCWGLHMFSHNNLLSQRDLQCIQVTCEKFCIPYDTGRIPVKN